MNLELPTGSKVWRGSYNRIATRKRCVTSDIVLYKDYTYTKLQGSLLPITGGRGMSTGQETCLASTVTPSCPCNSLLCCAKPDRAYFLFPDPCV